MKSIEIDRASCHEPATFAIDDNIGDLFHDAQNGVHLIGMELELVSMGLGTSSDAVKTAAIVSSWKTTCATCGVTSAPCSSPPAPVILQQSWRR